MVAGVQYQPHKELQLAGNEKYWANLDMLIETLTPKRVLELTPEALRSVGLSKQKAAYVVDLATHFHEGRLEGLENMSDDELRYACRFTCVAQALLMCEKRG
jgi:3-methyladenine DNA glycosylase/8-oxoguanine DNA glycosylase